MTKVVIMAGGRGLRLHPLTEKQPKPLIRVGSKPLLETIVSGFVSQGFTDITLCVHYRAELIERHFGGGSEYGCAISYIHEPEPMGTAGALKYVATDEPFIVSNADIIADIGYNALMIAHAGHGREATACLGLYQHQVPYGVYEDAIREKPILNYRVLAGVYVLPPRVHSMIEGHCDMPQLLNRLTVGTYEIEGYWIDMGHFADLAAAHINWNLKVAV